MRLRASSVRQSPGPMTSTREQDETKLYRSSVVSRRMIFLSAVGLASLWTADPIGVALGLGMLVYSVGDAYWGRSIPLVVFTKEALVFNPGWLLKPARMFYVEIVSWAQTPKQVGVLAVDGRKMYVPLLMLLTADQGRLVAALEDLNLEKPGSPKIVAGDLKRRERLLFWPLTALYIAFLVAMAVFLFYMYYTYGW